MRAEKMRQRHFHRHLGDPRHSQCAKIVHGFSLVELMVALALSLFLIGGVIATFTAARNTAAQTETLSRVQENIRFASDYLVRDLRNAGFRDELTLTFDQLVAIQNEFAAIVGDNDEILVRYAGRGSCGHVLSSTPDLKVIENRYFVDEATRDLRCTGVELDENLIETQSATVTLASDVAGMAFQFLDIDGLPHAVTECAFPTRDPDDPNILLDPDCTGVRIHLRFEGQADRVAELNVSFRNVILDLLYERL